MYIYVPARNNSMGAEINMHILFFPYYSHLLGSWKKKKELTS